jgi:signal transduction histidine kinase
VYHVRLGGLFSELDCLAGDAAKSTPEIREEVESLRQRMLHLKMELLRANLPEAPEPSEPAAATLTAASPPLLYEPEIQQAVYPEGESGPRAGIPVSVPLAEEGLPLGQLQIVPPGEEALTPDQIEIVNTVAQQVSAQIQSLRLLSETERARAEAESASRRFMHEGWAAYLDAIHQQERIGYAYDQAAVRPYTETSLPESSLRESIQMMDEQVGEIVLTPDPDRTSPEADQKLLADIAAQVAQQVENIRLLADASRARAEADEVIRRITREGWESYTTRQESESLSYVYDSNQVARGTEASDQEPALVVPLQVRGEIIGQLAVGGISEVAPDSGGLAEAIAAQASAHLEVLRLNEELQKRAAELLELDRLKSGFLANMSHELRTPLNSILGFADVIIEGLDGPLTPNMSTDLRLIQKNGQHLLHLINDVLDMAKISAGRMNLNPEKLLVYDVVEEVVSITSTLASEKNLALFIEPESDMQLEIVADRTRLRQVMINLINNAIKFTEKGKIAILITKKDTGQALIRVKDTGIGIPPEKLETIFQEFTQVDTSSTRKAGGTGLGLPISRKLVSMHGGSLWAESNGIRGEGSTLFVEMPVVARLADVVEKTER